MLKNNGCTCKRWLYVLFIMDNPEKVWTQKLFV